jgi:hypothetical protein
MFAKVVLASKPTNGAPPIIAIHTRHPRIIHSEWMTHRVFSRNARSSRAVPVTTMLKEIRETPFVPWHWGKNQKGMQAAEECNEIIKTDRRVMGARGLSYAPREREDAWLLARDNAVEIAEAFSDAGYHKQIANRLLEPFMWIDVLTTSTSWANFLHLRDHKDAEPHFRDLAQMVKEAIEKAEFQTLEPGEWHRPYIEDQDLIAVGQQNISHEERCEMFTKLSVARCARISYAPFDGDASLKKELERYDLLVGSDPLHASPAEHQATPDQTYNARIIQTDAKPVLWHDNGDGSMRALNEGAWREQKWLHPELAGNLGPGWIQYRKTLPGEYVAD